MTPGAHEAPPYGCLPGTSARGFESRPPRAVAQLLIVHGLAEYAGRYAASMAALAQHGIACVVYDQRGHGYAAGARTDIADFAQFAADLRELAVTLQTRDPDLPLFVWGHSMGSVVLSLAACHSLRIQGAITTGCALDALGAFDGVRGTAARLAAALAPRLRVSLAIDASWLSRVTSVQEDYRRNQLIAHSATLRLLRSFAGACKSSAALLGQVQLPWLAVHGDADRICPLSGSQRLIAALGSTDKRLLVYPAVRHEPHQEDDATRARLFADMGAWLHAQARQA